MQVLADWDRPHLSGAPGIGGNSAASYYPPLRFPCLADEAENSPVKRWGTSVNGSNGGVRTNGTNGNAVDGGCDLHVSFRPLNGAHSGVAQRTEDVAEASGHTYPNGNLVGASCASSYSSGAFPVTNGHTVLNGSAVAGGYASSYSSGAFPVVNGMNDAGNLRRDDTCLDSPSTFGGLGSHAANGTRVSANASTAATSSTAPPMSWPDSNGRGRAPASPRHQHRDVRDDSDCTASAPAPTSLTSSSEPLPSATVTASGGRGADNPDVEVRGEGEIASPWRTWNDVVFPSRIRSPLLSAGFPAPTSIQQYAWPIIGSGRDLVGIAKTGSGKTLAFLLAPFAKLLETGADLRGPPAILVLAPTRELACQIEQEAKQFGAPAGMRATCLYGGAPKGPQLAELRQRPQVLVATPGRLNDLLDPPPGLTMAVDVKSVRWLVLDEADRMLDMGFEPQIRKIIALLPKQRQTVMFTATWPLSVRRLAADFQRDPVEVRVGDVEQLRVNPDIEQRFIVCSDALDKEERLAEVLRDHPEDQVIIFVNTKRMCETVSFRTQNSVVIHGDKDQQQRDAALALFKAGTRRALVATDVAARGLDIKSVTLVVNFDPPNRDEDYVHRVGRTGRAGRKGVAVTLLTNEDGNSARAIVDMLKRDGLPVPEEISRRLESGEMRSGGNRSSLRGRSLEPSRGRRLLGGMDDPFDDDFGSRSMGGIGRSRAGDFRNMCDCPT